MAKKEEAVAVETATAAPQEPAEFKVTLGEYLSEIPTAKVETKAAFAALCREKNINGNKLRGEWQAIMNLFNTQPLSISWEEWIKKGGK